MNYQQIPSNNEDPYMYNNSQLQNCFHSSNEFCSYLTSNTGYTFSPNYDTHNYTGIQNDTDSINNSDVYQTQSNSIEAASFTEELNHYVYRNDQRGSISQLEPHFDLLPYKGDIVSNALSGALFDQEPVSQNISVSVQEGQDILEEMNTYIQCSENEIKEQCETITRFYTSDYDTYSGKVDECRVRKKRKRPNFNSEQTMYLKEWMINNRYNPYPDEDVKDRICFQTNLTLTQLNYWLINARKRYLPKYSQCTKELNDKTYN